MTLDVFARRSMMRLLGRLLLVGLMALGLVEVVSVTSAISQAPNTQCIASASAQGTPDAITIAALPCALTTNLLILTASGANTSTSPTLQPLGLSAQVIVRPNLTPLSAGDIGGVGYKALLTPTGSVWVLLNPANLPSSATIDSPTFTGTITGGARGFWSGDQFFGSGRPWCDVRAKGAIGNGSANDGPAIQTCANEVQAFGGGTVYFSAGAYCAPQGVSNTTGSVNWLGGNGVFLESCGGTANLLLVNFGFSQVKNLTLGGPQLSGGVAPSGSTLVVGSLCTECSFQDLDVVWGAYGVANASADSQFLHLNVTEAYGGGLIYGSLGGYFIRDTLDQNWAVSRPVAGSISSISAWQSGHLYATTGTIVSTGGFNLQQSSGSCTSGGVAPIVANYGTTISDGGCSWLLLAPTSYSCFQADSGTAAMFVWGMDCTGPFSVGFAMTNGGSGGAPQGISITDGTFGEAFQAEFQNAPGVAGSNLTITGGIWQNCIFSNCTLINLTSAWLGDLKVSNATLEVGALGVNIAGGVNNVIVGGQISGMTAAGVGVSAGVSGFGVIGVNLGTSPNWGTSAAGVVINAGGSDNYNVTGNGCAGLTQATCVEDGGTGTHKNVGGNMAPSEQGSTLLSVASASGSTVGTLGFSSTFNDYEIVADNLVPSVSGVAVELQVHSSGGSWQNSGYLNSNGNITGFVDVLGTALANLGTTGGAGFSGTIRIHNTNSTSVNKAVLGAGEVYSTTTGGAGSAAARGWWNGGQNALDGFQILPSSGSWTSGTLKVYGLRSAL